MTEAQRRHLSVSVRYVDQLLDDAVRAVPHLPDHRRQRIADAVRDVRSELSCFAERFALELRTPHIDPLHAVRVQLSVASVSVAEMRSRSMRGYGPLDLASAADLDTACDTLDAAIQRAQRAVDAP